MCKYNGTIQALNGKATEWFLCARIRGLCHRCIAVGSFAGQGTCCLDIGFLHMFIAPTGSFSRVAPLATPGAATDTLNTCLSVTSVNESV